MYLFYCVDFFLRTCLAIYSTAREYILEFGRLVSFEKNCPAYYVSAYRLLHLKGFRILPGEVGKLAGTTTFT